MSSGFSENKDLWGLLSLAGSQNLSYVDLILHLPNLLGHILVKEISIFLV